MNGVNMNGENENLVHELMRRGESLYLYVSGCIPTANLTDDQRQQLDRLKAEKRLLDEKKDVKMSLECKWRPLEEVKLILDRYPSLFGEHKEEMVAIIEKIDQELENSSLGGEDKRLLAEEKLKKEVDAIFEKAVQECDEEMDAIFEKISEFEKIHPFEKKLGIHYQLKSGSFCVDNLNKLAEKLESIQLSKEVKESNAEEAISSIKKAIDECDIKYSEIGDEDGLRKHDKRFTSRRQSYLASMQRSIGYDHRSNNYITFYFRYLSEVFDNANKPATLPIEPEPSLSLSRAY